MSYMQFSKKVGLSHTTLHRIETRHQKLSVDNLTTVLNKLKIKLKDIFPDEF